MKTIKDKEASIKSRLLNISKIREVDYNALLRHYFQERFLARLAVSQFKNFFILKGSFLFLAYNIPGSRLTQDIDFLGRTISSDYKILIPVFREIAEIKLDDGVIFDVQKIETAIIKESAKYQGQRIYIPCSMGSIKNRIQIDIGFGDKLTKQPMEIELLSLISENANSRLNAYYLETALAEKFESIVALGMVNSRMKDFYDLIFIASGFPLNGTDLANSIKLTFDQRKNNLGSAKYIFSTEFSESEVMQKKWSSFLTSRDLSVNFSFQEVVNRIEIFLKPCLNTEDFKAVWNPEKFRWEEV